MCVVGWPRIAACNAPQIWPIIVDASNNNNININIYYGATHIIQ